MSKTDEIKDGGTAFPISRAHFTSDGRMLSADWTPGMSLRDWFAGQAMAAFITRPTEGTFDKVGEHELTWNIGKLSGAAYAVADAMLKARIPQPLSPSGGEKP